MPIPVYEQRTRASQAGLGPGPMDSGRGIQALGAALGQVGDVLLDVREREAAAESAVALSKAQVDWSRRLYEAKQTAQPGAPDFTKNILSEFDKYETEAIKGVRTNSARQFMRQRLAAYRTQIVDRAMEFEATARVAHRETQFTTAKEQYGAATDLDPDGWMERGAEMSAVIDGMGLPPIEAETKRKEATDYIMSRAALAEARRDPDATTKRLVAPAKDDMLFLALTPAMRDELLKATESEQRARWAEENQEYSRAERAEKDAKEAASKDMDERLAAGNLSAAWLEDNRDRLAPEDYRYGYRQLSGEGDGPRNLQAYIDLRDRAGRGEDVRDMARASLTSGKISRSDYDRLLSEVESTWPNWYKRGQTFLSTSSGYSDLNPTPDTAQAKANMLDDWNDWARKNPGATDAQAEEGFRHIARQYALVKTTALKTPRYLAGSRLQPDLAATKAATVKAFNDGRISREEFDREAALLRQWERDVAAMGMSNGR